MGIMTSNIRITDGLQDHDIMIGTELLENMTPFVSRPVSRVPRAKSAPVRTPEMFPMDMDITQVRRFIRQKQAEYSQAKADATMAGGDSKDLRQYGKCLFEYAVSKAATRPTHASGTTTSRRPATCGGYSTGRVVVPTRQGSQHSHRNGTGPSSHGSLIYNKKVMVLNSIRTRPSSVPVNEYSFDRSKRFLNLRKTVDSPQYPLRVITANNESPRQLTSTDHYGCYDHVLLIAENDSVVSEYAKPVVEKTDEPDNTIQNTEHSPPRCWYRKPSIPILVQIDSPDSDSDMSLEIIPENKLSDRRPSSRGSMEKGVISPKPGSAGSRGSLKTRKKSPAGARDGVKLGKSDGARSSSPSSQNLRPTSATRGKTKDKAGGMNSRRGSLRGQKASPEDLMLKIPLPGPHCWVDDVTVSSDPMGGEEGMSEPANSVTDEPKSAKWTKEKTTTGTEEHVLPGFVCPSSELKSRSAATKQWLIKSAFLNASRAVPLL
ncbi:uncharacterized protein LOC135471730 [Liolophura sinensis]|uniref:uncharacterized protein LOC135471730 n=1 Tax=Liolophura sinensis TaxID=3198878 RepID=UPI0031595037